MFISPTSILQHIELGRFQFSMLLLAALGAGISAIGVALDHYQGSYGKKIMYSPIIFSVLLAVGCLLDLLSLRMGRVAVLSAAALLAGDGIVGFVFHLRGIARKPGGLRRNIVHNIVMGPPPFAPLLLGISSAMAVVAVYLLPENSKDVLSPALLSDLQCALAAATAVSSALNGAEALYSHYKSNFDNPAQWIPVLLAPLLFITASIDTVMPRRAAFCLLWLATAALVSGGIGVIFHLRGVMRRPGFSAHMLYSFIYGPPLFAPLLFSASGMLGLFAVFVGKTLP